MSLRVLQIVSGVAIGAQSGGAEQFAARLAIGLPGYRFERALFAMWRYGGPAEAAWLDRLEQAGVRVVGLVQPTGRLAHDLRAVWSELWRFAGDFQPAIVNSHSERGDVLNAALRLLHPAHPTSVRTMHTDQQWQDRPRFGWLMLHGLFPIVFAREIAISAQTRDTLEQRRLARTLGRVPIVCYNGIEAEWFSRQASETSLPLGIPSGRPALIVVGRLARQKGHDTLLEALALVRERVPAHLWIVGSGPLEEALRSKAVELGLEDAAHFLGSQSEVAPLLKSADLLVSSSLWEGFPTVILEAMAMKTPVVATAVSGSRELVKPHETGLLAEPGNPQSLADAILAVLAAPQDAQRMAEQAWVHAQTFTLEATIARYATLYEGLAQ